MKNNPLMIGTAIVASGAIAHYVRLCRKHGVKGATELVLLRAATIHKGYCLLVFIPFVL